MKRIVFSLLLVVLIGGVLTSETTFASKSNQIDTSIYYNYGSMSEAQITNWISGNFPASCLLSQNYPAGLSSVTFREPLSYFDYGGNTSPARIIWKASQFYSLNPQVILTTLEKESDLVTGNKGCAVWRYNSAMGYNCPTGAEEFLKDYPNIGIYDTCVQTESHAGFSRQVNHAAWQLSFDGKRANGELSWMGDGSVYYYGRMTQGYRARVNGGAQSYYDGYTTINGEAVYLSNGPTAALYNYTPFFTRFETIFTGWFGSAHVSYSADIKSSRLFSDAGRTNELEPIPTLGAGQTVYVTIRATNTGSKPWDNSFVKLGTSQTFNRSSTFRDSSWSSAGRPAVMKEPYVPPGAIGTFEFSLTASQDGSFTEAFRLVAEGRQWMLDNPTVVYNIDVSTPYNGKIESNKVFADSLYSAGTHSKALRGDTLYWRTEVRNTGTNPWSQSLTRIGTNNPKNRASIFSTPSWISDSRLTALEEDSVAPGEVGTFDFEVSVPNTPGVYREDFQPVVEGAAWLFGAPFDATIRSLEGRDRIVKTQWLQRGEGIESAGYRLVLQSDGNLVIYNPSNKALWSSGTKTSQQLSLQGDGNLVLYDSAWKPLWSSGTKTGHRFIMQGDGNLVLYDSAWKPLWSSGTRGQ